MLKGKTAKGFEFAIEKNTLDNYELVEALGDIDTNPFVLTKVVNLLLGKEQKEQLKEHVRDEEGIVTTTALMAEIEDIFNTQSEVKK